MAHQQFRSVRRQGEILDAVERGRFAHRAAVGGDVADFVIARPGAVAQEPEAAAVGRQLRCRHFPRAAGQRARCAVAIARVQVRIPALFRLEPQRAAGRPAEIVERVIDPGRIGEPVPRLQRRVGQVDRRQPAILVVDRAHHHRDAAAVAAPADRRRAAVVATGQHLHLAVAFQRLLAGGLAQRGERIAGDAGQDVELEFAGLRRAHVDQPQPLRQRRVAADAGAHVLEFLVARFGDVLRHLAGRALVGGLGGGHHQQPAAVGRQRAVGDLDVVAEVDRRRRAGRVGLAPGVFLRARGVAPGAVVLQGFDQAQLPVAQVIGFRRGVRILFRLDQRGLHHAITRGPAEPVVAHAPAQLAVAAPLRLRFVIVAAGDLRERAVAQVAHEHVAVADEGHARALRIEHRLRRVEVGARGAVEPGRDAGGDRLHVRVADGRAFALERVVRALSVPRPPGLLHRRADPVGVGHDLLHRQRGRRLRRRGGGKQGEEQRKRSAHGA